MRPKTICKTIKSLKNCMMNASAETSFYNPKLSGNMIPTFCLAKSPEK